jgi:hypothetical protein
MNLIRQKEVAMPTEEQIRELAYQMWEQQGRPEGKDVEHYFAAKQILEEQEAAQAHASRQWATSPAPAARRRGSRGWKR